MENEMEIMEKIRRSLKEIGLTQIRVLNTEASNTILYLVSVLAETQNFLKEHKAFIMESKMVFEKGDEETYQATVTIALDRSANKAKDPSSPQTLPLR